MLLLFRVSENVKCERAGIRIFLQTVSVSVTKNSLGKPLVCHYFRISKSFMLERVVTIYCRNFFCLAVSKISYGGSSVFHKLSGIENFMETRIGGREGGSIKIFP